MVEGFQISFDKRGGEFMAWLSSVDHRKIWGTGKTPEGVVWSAVLTARTFE